MYSGLHPPPPPQGLNLTREGSANAYVCALTLYVNVLHELLLHCMFSNYLCMIYMYK